MVIFNHLRFTQLLMVKMEEMLNQPPSTGVTLPLEFFSFAENYPAKRADARMETTQEQIYRDAWGGKSQRNLDNKENE